MPLSPFARSILVAGALLPAEALAQTTTPVVFDAWHETAPQLASTCRAAIAKTQGTITEIFARPRDQWTLQNTVLAVEEASAQLSTVTGGQTFLYSVAPDKAVRDSSIACAQAMGNFYVELAARPDLFAAAVATDEGTTVTPLDHQLLKLYLESGRRAGASQDSATRVRTTPLFKRLNDVTRDFGVALDGDSITIRVSADERTGLPQQLRSTMTPIGNAFTLRVDESTRLDFLAYEASRPARERYFMAYYRRGGAGNIDRIVRALAIRDTLSHLLGYPNWAAYQLDVKMAKTPDRVLSFLHQIDVPLKAKYAVEEKEVGAVALADGMNAPLQRWDYYYYFDRLRRSKYALDQEAVRRYFPVDHVLPAVLAIYAELFSVKFKEVTPADAWAPGVREFTVHDAASDALLGYVFFDLYPRPNKYGHFADFGLQSARTLADGARQLPVTAIVGNWPTPEAGKPSLLTHADVITFFHEFGHAMSSVFDASPYLTTGTGNLRQDFVEALSQALENWMWQPSILKRVSKHVDTGAPMPDSLIQRLIALKHIDDGYAQSRQTFYATYDVIMHSETPATPPVELWEKVYLETTGVPWPAGTLAPASLGHIMQGYDAGLYGYLWSKVYAQDLFTRFLREGIMNPATGRAYREMVLAPGAMVEPDILVQQFLGRPVNYDAFYKEIGVDIGAGGGAPK